MNTDKIEDKLKKLKEHIALYKKLWIMTARADGGALFPIDLLSTAVTHRAMCLVSGFCEMIEKKNFICAAPMIRLNLDNLLRFYATWLVDDPHSFAENILEGRAVGKLKDRTGQKMSDKYLAEKLSNEYPWIPRVYRETSGYIHLSSKHYFNTVRDVHNEDRSTTVAIGPNDTSITNEVREEAIDAMIAISEAVLRYLHGWAFTKEKVAAATQAREK
ncbi:MAG: hypothetical protein WC476_02680 [Phycisphaerae bacterium]|jgi:hypothetical protein